MSTNKDESNSATTNSRKKWKTFLSSIDHFNKLPSNNLEVKNTSNIDCLATQFATARKKEGDLDVSKNQTEKSITKEENETNGNTDEQTRPQACRKLCDQTDTNKDVNQASANFADVNINEESQISETEIHIKALVNNTPIASFRRIHQSKDTPSRKISSSYWTISNIADYFIFDNYVTKLVLPTTYAPFTDNINERARNDIFSRLEMVKDIDLKAEGKNADDKSLIQLKSVTCTEAGSRLVLDDFLVLLCSTCDDLKIELEKTISCDLLPICTFDYCIRKGERIIGCVETKSVKSLHDSSVAQAVLQLMMLQKNLIETETLKADISKYPLFAIVTDGHRFIYMQLKGSSLGFEHDEDKQKENKLRIRTVTAKSDFIGILQDITFLVKEFEALNEDDAILTD